MARPIQLAAEGYRTAASGLNWLQPFFLLAIRLYIGWLLFKAGRGKLMNVEATAATFASWHIPWPMLNVYLSGTVETVGGILLMLGLAARLAAIPIIGNMLVAYATAHPDELQGDSVRYQSIFESTAVFGAAHGDHRAGFRAGRVFARWPARPLVSRARRLTGGWT